jgi:hypothetical protein
MTDQPAAGAEAIAGTEGGQGGAAPAAPQPGAVPEWLQGLPPELQGDQTLSRYQNIEALARGHVETKKAFGSRIAVPGADAKPEEWDGVWKALGRPDGIDGYEVPVMEGIDPETTKPFRELAHKLGLNPTQAKELAGFHNQLLTQAEADYYAEGEQSLQAVKDELGDGYAQAEADAKAAFAKLFPGADGELADAIDRLVGSGPLVKAFANAAKLIGETGRIDGGGGDALGVGDAEAEGKLKELNRDAGWRDKLKAGDATTVAQHQRLLDAARRHAAATGIV